MNTRSRHSQYSFHIPSARNSYPTYSKTVRQGIEKRTKESKTELVSENREKDTQIINLFQSNRKEKYKIGQNELWNVFGEVHSVHFQFVVCGKYSSSSICMK